MNIEKATDLVLTTQLPKTVTVSCGEILLGTLETLSTCTHDITPLQAIFKTLCMLKAAIMLYCWCMVSFSVSVI